MKKKPEGNDIEQEASKEQPETSKPDGTIKPSTPTALGEELELIFDISQEIELLKEIKDIRDELNILRSLYGQQMGCN